MTDVVVTNLVGVRKFPYKGVLLNVDFYQTKYGEFAAIAPDSWEEVHLDDWCTAALDFRDWLEFIGLEVIPSKATIDNSCAPYFWVKE